MKVPLRLAAASVFGVACSMAAPASAHTVGLSRGDFAVEQDGTVRALLVFSRRDAALLGEMDRDRDGTISPSELAASEEVFRRKLTEGVIVRADGERCSASLDGGGDAESDGFGLSAVFRCKIPDRSVEVKLPMLDDLPPGSREIVQISDEHGSSSTILASADQSAFFAIPPRAGKAAPSAGPGSAVTLLGSVALGVDHILTGWDHLLFLAALVLVAESLGAVVASVSAFTLAHSITLALAALGLCAPDPRWIEPAIAASIVFVAVENVVRRRPGHRWRVALAFGLVHGFGFAGVLQGLHLARERLLPTLLGFNVGVELGQLCVLVAGVAVFALVRKRWRFQARLIQAASASIGVLGAGLFVARIMRP